MTGTKFKRTVAVFAALVVLASGIAAPAAGQIQNSASAANSTQTTAAQTGAQDECGSMSSPPSMSQAQLYAPQKTIKASQPGKISGGFQVDPTATCPVVVHITMSVPSGMSIEGSSDLFSGGAGMVSGNFEVRPSGGIKDISADVYSSNTGKRTVTADITYWPKGHKDMAQEIDGMSFTFDVQEPIESSGTGGSTEGGEGGDKTTAAGTGGSDGGEDGNGLPLPTNVIVILGLMTLIGVAFLTMTKMSPRDINIGVNK
ncbi:hypothetical protein [Halorussus lipolyticus]|uniref:hypothetical protein n=1 Tax=Halorussus lipolyticus TaxID=3034024 RepID=UPI0023E760B0|nr:hypothetical protein [Halorussus sp. DT80]